MRQGDSLRPAHDWVGFREWPVGRERAADDDSGPIVEGVGAAATGLSIGAARAMGDEALALRVEATAAIIDALARASPALGAFVAHGSGRRHPLPRRADPAVSRHP